MARYKLRLPSAGQTIYSDDGTVSMVATTINEARDAFEDYEDERPLYLHATVGRCRVAYKADVENGDAHEGAEPGDTTIDYAGAPVAGYKLGPNEVLLWEKGAPPVSWTMRPLREPVKADDIPVGTTVHHVRLGSGKTVAKPRRLGPARVFVDVEWTAWDGRTFAPTKTLACSVSALMVMPGHDWPKARYSLEVEGEHLADGADEVLRTLLDIRRNRLNAEWEARMAAEYEAVAA